MHGEGGPYVFMTALAYVALRLLGLGPEHPLCAPARDWLQSQPGGVCAIPTWGKFWLAMLGLYEYDGLNPIPPELFLLPDWVPLHPNNYYCHTRYIYLGIAYLYGRRFTHDFGPIRDDLRRELYGHEYGEIDFAAHRHDIAPSDLHVRPSLPLRTVYDTLTRYEKLPLRPLRRRALRHCFERIVYEQEASRGQGLSPVNGLLNCLALFTPSAIRSSNRRCRRWSRGSGRTRREGIRYCGAHSTSWDTAFAMRAMLDAPLGVIDGATVSSALRNAYGWLRDAQMQTELPPGFERERREPIVGGWCFSDGMHRWPVSDCTAEALTALFEAHEIAGLIAESESASGTLRLEAAARFILRRQNDDGGFGTYESRRGSLILEHINPSEMYGNCMTERSYTECTASCVGALARFRRRFPATLRDEIDARRRSRRRAVALAPARRRLVPRLLGRQLHLRHLPRRRGAARQRRVAVRPGDRARHRVAPRQAEARRWLGRALAERGQRHLRRASRVAGGDDGVGAAGAFGGAAADARGGAARRRVAARDAKARRSVAAAVAVGRLLLDGDARLPTVQGLLPGLGAGSLFATLFLTHRGLWMSAA